MSIIYHPNGFFVFNYNFSPVEKQPCFPFLFLTKFFPGSIISLHGLVAQLGAHHIRIVGVGSSNLLKSTTREPDELTNCDLYGWQFVRPGVSAEFSGQITKEAIAFGKTQAIASFGSHSHNEMRYFLTKHCGIRMNLLELTAKEHGYD